MSDIPATGVVVAHDLLLRVSDPPDRYAIHAALDERWGRRGEVGYLGAWAHSRTARPHGSGCPRATPTGPLDGRYWLRRMPHHWLSDCARTSPARSAGRGAARPGRGRRLRPACAGWSGAPPSTASGWMPRMHPSRACWCARARASGYGRNRLHRQLDGAGRQPASPPRFPRRRGAREPGLRVCGCWRRSKRLRGNRCPRSCWTVR